MAATDLSRVGSPPVIDYEGSQYRTDFWEGQGRAYEDAVERLALTRLMPPRGIRIAEIGAGFGRLADQYDGYEQVILFDYSRTLLQDAAARWGHDPRFVFVAGNVYQMPFADGILDTLIMIRVMHHLADVPRALEQLRRVMHRHSIGILEYANKRNMKAVLRWLTKRQDWSPLDQEPVEFVKLNYDFHPAWMDRRLEAVGFDVSNQLSVSHFRHPLLKEYVCAHRLARWDSRLFDIGGRHPMAPSVFVQVEPCSAGGRAEPSCHDDDLVKLFCCPVSGSHNLERVEDGRIYCPESNLTYVRRDGVWDFKDAVHDTGTVAVE